MFLLLMSLNPLRQGADRVAILIGGRAVPPYCPRFSIQRALRLEWGLGGESSATAKRMLRMTLSDVKSHKNPKTFAPDTTPPKGINGSSRF